MFWTLLALLSLIVLGGFLAYYGDLQGRRWGKKRVSWFGLRPKHTAILITSLTGAFVALLSVATLLLVSPTVRDVVLRGEQAIRENKDLMAQAVQQRIESDNNLRETRAQLSIAQAKSDSVRNDYMRICSDYNATQKLLEKAQGELNRLVARNMELQRDKFKMERTLASEKSEVGKLQVARRTLTTQIGRAEDINQGLARQNLSMARENSDMEKRNAALEKAYQELAENTEKLRRESDDLTLTNKELTGKNSGLEAAYHRLLDANEEETQRVKSEIQTLLRKRDEMNTQLVGLGQTYAQSYLSLLQGKMVLAAGELLGQRILDAHRSKEVALRELTGLLEDASAIAQIRGAARGDNGRAVRVVNKRIVTLVGQHDTDEQASINALAENLVGSDTPVVLMVKAVNNTVEGDQVLVEFGVRPLKLLYDRGAIVASRQVDASQPLDRVVEALVQFLQSDVRNAAVQVGMIPQVDRTTGTKQVGILGPADLVLLTERVQKMGGKVQVTAVAAGPTTSADPLRLTFKLARPRTR